MAEAVAEPQTAAADENVKLTEATNGSDSKPADATTNGKRDEKDGGEATNGEKAADEEDNFERYNTDKPDRGERRDKGDYKRRDNDDRGRRGGRNDRGRGRGRGGGGGGRGRGGRGDYNNNRYTNNKENIRTRFERQEESDDAAEIRRQVEFYFSDSNLPIDRFLLEETGGPENKPFPLRTIHQFKRMRHFQPFSAVVDAVKGSDFLVVNDKEEVSRQIPLDSKFTLDVMKNGELLTDATMLRSIYAKGFGEEKSRTAFEIEELFEPYGVRGVRLRREKDGTFKGSCFIEFDSEEAAKQFLEMEEKPKFEGNELLIMGKKEYVDLKMEGIYDGTVKPNSPSRRYSGQNGRGGRGGRYNKGDRRGSFNGGYQKRKRDDGDNDEIDKNNWRERRERFQRADGKDEFGRDNSQREVNEERSRSPYRENMKRQRSASPEKKEDAPADTEGEKKVEEAAA